MNKVALIVLLIAAFLPLEKMSAMTVAPLRHVVVADPGDQVSVPVFVINDEDTVRTFTPSVDGFHLSKENGSAVFGDEVDAIGWYSVRPEIIRLGPGERGQFNFNFQVPEDVSIGERYLGLFVQEPPGKGSIKVGARVGSLMFLNISGEIDEELIVSAFEVDRNWVGQGSAAVLLNLENKGNISVESYGEVKYFARGDKEIYKEVISKDRLKVLSRGEATVKFYTPPLSIKDIGKITAKVNITYGLTKKEVSAVADYWFVPFWVITATLVVLLSSIILLVKRFIYVKNR